MSKKCICSFIFCLVLGMLFVGCCYAEEEPMEPIQLFAEQRVSRTISTPGENLVPIEFGEIPVHHVNMKANNEKLALFYIDYDGLHVIPIAKGKFNITFTNEDSKKDKTALEIVIEESSIEASDDLKAYAVIENSFVRRYNELTVKYYISGGKKPYQCVVRYEDFYSTAGNMNEQEFKAKNSLGKFKFYSLGGMIRTYFKVLDADGNTCQVEANPVVALEDYALSIRPAFDPVIMSANEKTEIPFLITGGTGAYDITESWQLKSLDGFTVQEEKKKYTSGDNVTVVILPEQTGELSIDIEVKDRKSKKKTVYQLEQAKVMDKVYLQTEREKRVIHIGEEAKIFIRAKGCGVDNVHVVTRYAKGETLPIEEPLVEAKEIGENYYELSFVPVERGFLVFRFYLDDGSYRISEMMSIIP